LREALGDGVSGGCRDSDVGGERLRSVSCSAPVWLYSFWPGQSDAAARM
jgi:hypothetical protein